MRVHVYVYTGKSIVYGRSKSDSHTHVKASKLTQLPGLANEKTKVPDKKEQLESVPSQAPIPIPIPIPFLHACLYPALPCLAVWGTILSNSKYSVILPPRTKKMKSREQSFITVLARFKSPA